MTCSQQWTSTLAAVLAVSITTHLAAGEITGITWYSGVASVAGTTFSPPVSPNNDDVVGTSDNEVWVTQKNYMSIGPVDLVFDVRDTGGVTEYLVIEGVFNATGLDWTGYHLELGYGVGDAFVKSTSGDGLDFDAPDFNSEMSFNPFPGFFPTVSATEHDIIASGGVMPTFMFAGYFRFHIDVPDGITSFTLRQTPISVPEPRGAILASLALWGLLLLRRHLFNRVTT